MIPVVQTLGQVIQGVVMIKDLLKGFSKPEKIWFIFSMCYIVLVLVVGYLAFSGVISLIYYRIITIGCFIVGWGGYFITRYLKRA